MRRFALNASVADHTGPATLCDPITTDKADRDILQIGPTLNGIGGIAFCGKNDLVGKTPCFDDGAQYIGLQIIVTNIATNSENS